MGLENQPQQTQPLLAAGTEQQRIESALGVGLPPFLKGEYQGLQFFGGWVNRQAFTPRADGAVGSATTHPDLSYARAAQDYEGFLNKLEADKGRPAREQTAASIAMMSSCQVLFIFPALNNADLQTLRTEGQKIVEALRTGVTAESIKPEIQDALRDRLAKQHHDVWAGNREQALEHGMNVAPHATHRSWTELEQANPAAITQDRSGQVNGYACVLGLMEEKNFEELLTLAEAVRRSTADFTRVPDEVAGYLAPRYGNDPRFTK